MIDGSEDGPAALAYAGPQTNTDPPPPWETRALKIVLACWLFQTALNVGTFIAGWLVFRRFRDVVDWTAAIGLSLGGALFLAAAVAALVFLLRRWGRRRNRWERAIRPALIGLLLNASNLIVLGASLAIEAILK